MVFDNVDLNEVSKKWSKCIWMHRIKGRVFIMHNAIKRSWSRQYFAAICPFNKQIWRYRWVIRSRISKKEQTIQWPNENDQKDKQWYTKIVHKTINTNSTTNRGALRCSEKVSSSFSTCGIRLINLITNPVMMAPNRTYLWSSVIHIFRND